jgi:hypothetical protein
MPRAPLFEGGKQRAFAVEVRNRCEESNVY